MSETGAATWGVLLAGAGLILAILAWPAGTLAGSALVVPIMVVGAAVATAAFSGSRHGRLDAATGGVVGAAGGLVLLVGGSFLWVSPPDPAPASWIAPVIALLGAGSIGLGAVGAGVLTGEGLAGRAQALLFGAALGFGGLFLAGALAAVPALVAGGVGVSLTVESAFALEQVGMAVGFVVATLAFVVWSGRGLGYLDIERFDRRSVAYVVGGTLAIVATAYLLAVVYSLLGIEVGEHAIARRSREQGVTVLLVAIPLAWIATAVGEELLFRNGVQKYLAERFTAVSAILFSCLVFTAAHIPAFAGQPAEAVIAPLFLVFTLSVILAVIYERTRNVLVTIVIHGSYNALVYLTILLQLTG